MVEPEKLRIKEILTTPQQMEKVIERAKIVVKQTTPWRDVKPPSNPDPTRQSPDR